MGKWNAGLLIVLIVMSGTILRYVRNRTQHVLERQVRAMATLQEVIDAQQATDDTVEAAAARVQVDIQALRDQIQALIDAGVGTVTAEDLDALVAKANEITGEAELIDPAPVVEPPVEPPVV